MYSRYIPPAPKGNVIREPSPKPVVVEVAPPQPTNVRPGSYSRYIPSAKAPAEPKKHLHYEEEDVVDALVSEQPPTKRAKVESNAKSTTETPDSAVNLSSKADKQSKKAKKDKKVPQSPPRSEEVPVADNTTAASDQPAESEDAVVDSEAKKERKKKKEKKKKPQPDDGDVASEDDEIRKRHKAVLERKNKSMTAPKPVTDDGDIAMQDAPEPVEVHGLEPLPQPAPVPEDTSIPEFETLPPWLAEPIRVSRQAAAPFTDFGLTPDLGISSELATRLAQKGYSEAFAIQTAVIPQLLPHHCRTMQSDILVSAATGSGKTLAYAVPVIRDLSQSNRHMTRLRALVVLPTRELVRQAQKVCEECAGIFALDGKKRRIKVGTATGYQSIQEERKVLLEREDRYDADAYHAKEKRLASRSWGQREDDDEEDEELAEIQRREDEKETLPNYVVGYKSRVDILICTPGRLVDHIKYTPGFNLDHVRWLIADEADKLLGQGFQQWLDIVIPKLHDDSLRARHHKQSNLVGVRKIILSATMTRDLDLLEGLRLRRPKLVVLEGSGARVDYSLPELLQESALKADANLKPLFLLDLLQSTHIRKKIAAPIEDDTSSSDSDSSDSDSDTDSDSDSDSDSDLDADAKSTKTPGRASAQQAVPSSTLIFTKSNQSALRLSRLLGILSPEIGEVTGLLTSETAYSTRKQTLQAFTNGKIRIIVASDLVARGIDFEHLENVINYDIPSSVASYVHRVGRTARAGRSGHAWTLFTDAEARWFWKEIAGGNTIQRSGKVERIRITEEKEAAFEAKKERYEVALQALGDEVMEKRRGR